MAETNPNLRSSAAVVGAYEHPLRAPDKSEWLMQAESIVGALDDAALERSDVDAFFTVAPSPEGGFVRESAASMLCDYLNLQPKFVDETDIGGAAFGLFVNRAVMAIHAGLIGGCRDRLRRLHKVTGDRGWYAELCRDHEPAADGAHAGRRYDRHRIVWTHPASFDGALIEIQEFDWTPEGQ